MYIINKKMNFDNQRKVADELELTTSTLSRILNGKQKVKKTTAMCIVQAYDKKAKVLDYFKQEN